MSLEKYRKLETTSLAKIIRLLWLFLALGKDSLMKPLALNKIRAEQDARLDQLFNMGSGLKISENREAANADKNLSRD